ncbi:dipeptidyl aminopeptidase/acylaminoacyl peptidase [Paenibacillus sp. V4I9]|uniref:S9 family peptidase n=1 Tax=Paenibacillus sp. V4I9 TaxID=3042308 RepID=UPI002785BA1A|nr:alpha/beta fold hydrolase [Paenibacillus sp. V4I9]MDQ0888778.1 dipeptidyl aminopeptidase/acylaminoacyl peptidase [Paenibacillus sp. V4I9]
MSNFISVEECLNIKELADRVPLELSCDGRWLAFTLNGLSNEKISQGVSMAVQGNSQWVCDLNTGEAFPIAPTANSSWSGEWSPDGETLAFFSDIDGAAQLWLWSTITRTLKRASTDIVCPFFGFEKPIWTLDGRYILVKSKPTADINGFDFSSSMSKSNESKEKKSRVVVYSTLKENPENNDQHNWTERYRGDIVKVDINSGRSVPLCIGLRPFGMAVSNDGKYLAFTNCIGQESKDTQQMIYDLWVCPIDDYLEKPFRAVSEIRMEYGLTFTWAINNNSVYYTSSGPKTEGELWSVNIAYPLKPIRLLAETGFGRSYDSPISLSNGDLVMVAKGALWRYRGTEKSVKKIGENIEREIISAMPLTSNGTNSIVVQTIENSNDICGFWMINLETEVINRVFEEPYKHLPWFEGGATIGENLLVYVAQSANEPPSIRGFNYKTLRHNSLVELSKVPKTKLGNSQLLTWVKAEKKLRGALLLPPVIKGPVPVIVRVYGGAEQSKNLRLFGLSSSTVDNHQLFASRGYAVYLPDLPLERKHEPLNELVEVLEDALNELFKHPDIDFNRIGIIGHSFGGYSALAAITKLQHFKAAVISAGIGSLISFYTQFNSEAPEFRFGWTEDGQGNMGATLWQDRERYIRNSPLFSFDKIQTPVLIFQGTRDSLCNTEAGPIFSALRRLNKNAEMVLYDEEHWQGTWSKDNLIDYYDRMFTWYKRFL